MSSQQRIVAVAVIVLLCIVSLSIVIHMLWGIDWSMQPPSGEQTVQPGAVTMPQTGDLIGWAGLLFLIDGAIVLIYFKTFGYPPLKKD